MMSTSVRHGRPSAVAAAALETAVAAVFVTQAVEGATFVLALAVVASSAVAAAAMGTAVASVVVTQVVEGATFVLALAVAASSAVAAAVMGTAVAAVVVTQLVEGATFVLALSKHLQSLLLKLKQNHAPRFHFKSYGMFLKPRKRTL